MTTPQAASQQQQQAVITAYQQQTVQLRDQLTALLVALWASLPAYRADDGAGFAPIAVSYVEGAMLRMQQLTTAYLATLYGLQGASDRPVAAADVSVSGVRNGADPLDVYQRPFHLVWRRLHDLKPLDGTKIAAAIKSGEDRAVQTALTDLQLAKTHTSLDVLNNDRSGHVVGYRRVLEGAHSCGLCVIASTARYHRADLMPIHPACDCSVAPIIGEEDPGHLLDAQRLADAHDAVAARFGSDSTAARDIAGAVKDNGDPLLYRDVLITHEHGELGPILAVRGQHWVGPSDLH